MDDVRQRFGAAVREVRARRGWSQEELAVQVGLHPTYVGGIEHGERNVSLVNIERLAAALGVRPSELMEEMERQDKP